jgi:hypothetical protein
MASTTASTITSSPTTPGVNPGADQGLMLRFSRRSNRHEATRTTAPNSAQAAALQLSLCCFMQEGDPGAWISA